MLDLNKLKDLYIYKNKKFAFPEKDNDGNRIDNLYLLFSLNIEDNINLINSKMYYYKNNYGYFLDKFIRMKIGGKLTPRIKNDINSIYKYIKSNALYIRKTYLDFKMYNEGYNIYYDLSNQLKLFNQYKIIYMFRKIQKIFVENILIKTYNNEIYDRFANKYVLINFSGHMEEYKEGFSNLKSVDNPIITILNYLYYNDKDIEEVFPKDMLIILFNTENKTFIKFYPHNIDKSKLIRLRMLLNRMNKIKDEDNEELLNSEIKDEEIIENNNEKEEKNKNITPKKIIKKVKEEKIDSDIMKLDKKINNEINNIVAEEEIDNKITNKKVKSLISNKNKTEITNKIKDEIAEKIKKEEDIINDNDMTDIILDKIKDDIEFGSLVLNMQNEEITANKNNASMKRDKLLKEKQQELKIKNFYDNDKEVSIKKLLTNEDKKIEKIKFNVPDLRNNSIEECNINNFNKSYLKNQYTKDFTAVLNSMQDDNRKIKIYIKDIKSKDSSDIFNSKETLTIQFEDELRNRHKVTLDVPKIKDGNFLYLNGNKKKLTKQLLAMPVTKNKADEVKITSVYRKLFLVRFGQKISADVEYMKKILNDNDLTNIEVKYADSTKVNNKYLNTIEYDDIASKILELKIRNLNEKYTLLFNHINIEELFSNLINMDKMNENYLPLGYISDNNDKIKSLLFIDAINNEIFISSDGINKLNVLSNNIAQFLIEKIINLNPDLKNKYKYVDSGKYVYTRATVLSSKIPLVLLLGFNVGLTELLKRANIKFKLDVTKKRTIENKNIGIIQFNDCYMYYEKNPFRNSLLLNALYTIPTKNYNFNDFNNKDTYTELFESIYGTKTIAKGYDNFIELFIDPITREVLEDNNYPTNFTDLLLYGNALLEDNSFTNEGDMSNYRLRGNEIINTEIYDILSTAYLQYKNTINSSLPTKISIPRNALIKRLATMPTVKDYSTINPVVEMEVDGSVSYKGPSGLNLDEAYTLKKREFDPSMLGIVALSTAGDSNVGINRNLTFNTNVLSNRGYLKVEKDDNNLDFSSVLSPSEMITPFTANHDDPQRVLYMTNQSKHVIPTNTSHKPLFGYGTEKILPNILSDDFVFKAKNDGKVIKIDEENKIMIVEYKDKTIDRINLADDITSNSGGGYYVPNTKDTSLKENEKFKKGDILAKNKAYFKGDKNDTTYTLGCLTKVAIACGYFTYEDSTLVTEKLAQNMASNITIKEDLILEPSANAILNINIGDKIEAGNPLITYENAFDKSQVNKLLSQIGKEYEEDIAENTRNIKTCKYSGKIHDIKCYYTCDFTDLSPSLQNIVNTLNTKIKKRNNILKKYGVPTSELTPLIEKIETDNKKVKSYDLDNQILFEFYITYVNPLIVGNKLTLYSCLKSVISEVIPNDLAPYTDSHPEEQVDLIVSPMSVSDRKVPSIYSMLYGNKVLIELKNKVREIFNS